MSTANGYSPEQTDRCMTFTEYLDVGTQIDAGLSVLGGLIGSRANRANRS